MNNYLRLLLHLKQYEGDGKEHLIEHLFPDTPTAEIKNILQELADEDFIKYSGREERYLSFVFEQNILTNESKMTASPFNDHILHSEPPPFKAKITFKGSRHLKEELQMQESGKYNISVSGEGANNTFVIESNNVTIDNKPNFSKTVEKIIETLRSDQSIDAVLKENAILALQNARLEVEKTGKLPERLMKGILQYGSEISSIGSLVYQLLTA